MKQKEILKNPNLEMLLQDYNRITGQYDYEIRAKDELMQAIYLLIKSGACSVVVEVEGE